MALANIENHLEFVAPGSELFELFAMALANNENHLEFVAPDLAPRMPLGYNHLNYLLQGV